MFWRKPEVRGLAGGGALLALGAIVALSGCDTAPQVATRVAEAAVRGDSARWADLRCLTRRPEDCLTVPVPADEPHEGICATCHDMWQNNASHSARSCSGGGCHEDAQKLSRFHRTLRPLALANCLHCHRPHDFRVARDGRQCSVCHQGGGQRVVWAELRDTLPGPTRVLPADLTFWHSDHESVTCVSCHGVADTHGAIKVRVLQDCRACHHAAARTSECLGCHANDKVFTSPLRVNTVLNIRIGSLNRPRRVLAFEHSAHQTYGCVTCHRTQHGVPDAGAADCSTCHAQHHTATANCLACHERPARGAHNRQSHMGCAGAGCHVDAPAPIRSAPRTRQLCLSCHTEMVQHEGGRNCSECHLLPRT